jgi:rubrerythrin
MEKNMSSTSGLDAPIVDGFYGLPPKINDAHGPQPGTIEWLLNAVEHHASAEADALIQYEQLAVASGDPVVALVMRLVLDDEERHHGLLKRIEASLRDALYWSHSPASLPISPTDQEPLHADLAAVAHDLVAEERTGARKMRELANLEKDISGGLHSLLLEMMAMDSDKHARLLHFVEVRLKSRAQAHDGPSD